MATVKGFIRSYGAAVRRAEREQQRRARDAAKRYKEQLKQEEIANAEEAVQNYNEYVEIIQSMHKNCTDEINWNKIKNELKPEEPRRSVFHEAEAQEKLNNFRPSIMDKMFGSTNKKINKLKNQVEEAKKKDDKEYELTKEQYLEQLEDWELLQKLAEGLDKKDPESYRDALQYFNPFSDIGELGTRIQFSILDNSQVDVDVDVDVDVHINGENVIPKYELKQTARGKLSKKSMSKSKYNELYQDHICSSIIRVSRELFAYLPLDKVRVNAIGQVLNSSTGHLEEKPILSVIMVAETINSLNMNTIDPSDSMDNFIHNMKFSKIKGFTSIDKVDLK